jgi:hypothetical protein
LRTYTGTGDRARLLAYHLISVTPPKQRYVTANSDCCMDPSLAHWKGATRSIAHRKFDLLQICIKHYGFVW